MSSRHRSLTPGERAGTRDLEPLCSSSRSMKHCRDNSSCSMLTNLDNLYRCHHRHIQLHDLSISPGHTDCRSALELLCESKSPPQGFLTFFQNGWEFLHQILHTYYTFLSTLDCTFLSNYLQFCSECPVCPPSAEVDAGIF